MMVDDLSWPDGVGDAARSERRHDELFADLRQGASPSFLARWWRIRDRLLPERALGQRIRLLPASPAERLLASLDAADAATLHLAAREGRVGDDADTARLLAIVQRGLLELDWLPRVRLARHRPWSVPEDIGPQGARRLLESALHANVRLGWTRAATALTAADDPSAWLDEHADLVEAVLDQHVTVVDQS